MWGGLPFIVPSNTAMKYLYHAKVMPEEDVPIGAHYRAREDMMNNVSFKCLPFNPIIILLLNQ
jgi:hypothetical protein